MKQKLMLSMATIALLTTSCSNEQDTCMDAMEEANTISFATYSINTKGRPIIGNSETNPTYNNMDYFKYNGRQFHVTSFLVGNSTTNKYMDAKIKFTNPKWDYADQSDKAYWPSTPLNFYAVTPETDSNRTNDSYNNTSGSESMNFNYTVPARDIQQDLMYAVEKGINKPANGIVTMHFKHALNQIIFKAKTESKNLKVELNPTDGITLHNIKSTGSFTTKDMSWSATDTRANYINKTPGTSVITIQTTTEAPNAVDLTEATNVLMLMPQTVTAWDINQTIATNNSGVKGAYLKISCKLIAPNGDSPIYLHGSKEAYATMYVPFAGTGMNGIGKKITYTLIFGGGYTPGGGGEGGGEDPKPEPILTPIMFDTEVTNWEVVSNTDINTQKPATSGAN